LGLAAQLVVLIVLATLCVGSVVGLAAIVTSRATLRQEILDRALAHTDLAAQYAADYIGAVQANVRLFATRPDIVRAALTNTPALAQGDLLLFPQIQTTLDSASLYDADGIMRVSSVVNAPSIGASFTDREWYQQVMATRRPYLGIPVQSRATGHAILPYVVPILDDQGNVRGILAAGISLTRLSEAIVGTQPAPDGRAALVDTRNGGMIVAHNDPSRILTPVSGQNQAVQRLISGERGTLETTSSSGELDLTAYAPVPDLPWGIMLLQPSATALGSVTALTRQAALLTILAILLATLLGVWWSLRVTGPLRRLSAAAQQLATGDLSPRLHFTHQDEIGDLGRAFDQMADTLAEKDQQIQAHTTELEQRVQERTAALSTLSQRQQALLAAIPDIIMEVDSRKTYVWANPAGRRFFGADVLGKSADSYFEGEQDTYARVEPLFNGDDSTIYVESWQRRQDGSKRLLAWWCRALKDEQGRPAGALSSARDITERQQMEDALRESEDKFKYVFDNSIIGKSITRPSGEISVNKAFCEMLGYSPEELKDRKWQDLTHPDDIEPTQKAVDRILAGEAQVMRLVKRYIRQDGSVMWADVGSSLRRDEAGKPLYFMTFVADITGRKRMEDALRESEEAHRLLVQHLHAGVVVHAPDTRILLANEQAAALLGLTRDQMLGKDALDPAWRFRREDETALPLEEYPVNRVIAARAPMRDQVLGISRPAAGDVAWVLVNAFPEIDANGKLRQIVVTFVDITQRRRAERQLQASAAELARSNKELEQFAYIASHDLQEPLRMVASYTQLLARRYRGRLDADADEFIRYAVDGANRMQTLISDLLAYSRVGTRSSPFQPADCNRVLGQALANLSVAIQESRAVVMNAELPTVMADESQLVQLFQNLIGNAIKFRSAEPPRVSISATLKDRAWEFAVCDNGIGFDPQYAERIFVIFQRLHNRQDYPGTGIGLAICKRIVERHGGCIWVVSEVGKGTTFYFTVPAA
jgi:PAS domain S-box-containing protein